ncbi:DoxX family protein [Ramlibacter sp. G-1-2-2]|uniref:DoxX family protein n=1 Tax=Ramlibacter agri TaxID=2728837 RepID=A0A848H702_9BURK|nr:DoxX family protein [Ramlibacter agri]NML45110.1 DoxX family protein [Ramlibacter agri]
MTTTTSHPLDAAQDAMSLIGRILVAVLFVPAGWGKLVGFAGTVGYIASKGVPLPEVAAAFAIFFELGCGLALLFGWKTRWAALGLAVFTIVITPIFHPFWADPSQKLNFWKNLAITGGLLGFASFGGGAFSLDGRRFAAHRPATA